MRQAQKLVGGFHFADGLIDEIDGSLAMTALRAAGFVERGAGRAQFIEGAM